MTQRTRSHILEEESRNQLANIIPSEWVVRDKPIDYGIDCEIEIFDKKGNTTGIVFWVQLKATDSKKKYLRLSLKKEKLRQFNSYPIPVLFLRYSSPLKTFYFEWSNKFYFLGVNSTAKSISLKFDNEWNEKTPEYIYKYLNKVNSIKKGNLVFPLKCSILNNSSSASIGYSLKSIFREYSEYIEFNNEESVIEITLYDNRMLITLMNEYATFFNISKKSFQPEILNKTISCGILIILAQTKKYDLFNIIFARINIKDYLKENIEILKFLIPHLLNGEVKHLDFVYEVVNNIDDISLEIITSITLLSIRENATKETIENIVSFFERLSSNPKRVNKINRSTYLYNIGNIYKSRGNNLKALNYFNKARKLNSKYLEYDYFLAELAGILFESEKYNLSKKLYAKSLEINEKEYIRFALYGDALMFSGNYAEAVINYNTFLFNSKRDSFGNSEYQLKFIALSTLLSMGYPKTQKRDIQEAKKIIRERENTTLENLEKAIEKDFLCAYAWYELGHKHISQNKLMDAYIYFLMSSVLSRNISVSWINCTVLALQLEQTDILYYHVINCAYVYCGDSYISELMEYISSLNLDFEKDIFKKIEETINTTISDKSEFRLIDNIGEVMKLSITK